MNNTKFTLIPGGIRISGEYYTVSNGLISKTHGKLHLHFQDLLAVEIVKRRSKKLVFAALILGSTLALFSNFGGIAALTITVAVVCVILAVYLSSARRYVEITSMVGTYRIVVEHRDSEIEKVVQELQKRIYRER